MILTTSWLPTGPLLLLQLVLLLFVIGWVLLAMNSTIESLSWIFLTWNSQAPFLHNLEISHFLLNWASQTIVFIVSFPRNWLAYEGWSLSTLDTTIWGVRSHGGSGGFRNLKSWIWMETTSLVHFLPPSATTYPLYKSLTSVKTSSPVSHIYFYIMNLSFLLWIIHIILSSRPDLVKLLIY